MKNKIGIGAGLIGLGIVLLSFVNGEEPKMKRYEVIRSVNGELTTFDTLVPENSNFTPEQYLEQLGFANDQHVEIIDMKSMLHPIPGLIMPAQPQLVHELDSLVMVEINGGPVSMDSMMIFEFEISDSNVNWEEGSNQIIMEKNIVIKHIDSIDNDISEFTELQRTIEIMLTDSLIEMFEMPAGDSGMVIMQTIIMNDGDAKGHEQMMWSGQNGEPDFERHTENGNQKSDLMVFSSGKDFTLVIVSDGTTPPASKSQLRIDPINPSANAIHLYPNPANNEVKVELSFDEKARTEIVVSDANGKIVMEFNLGDFAGNHTQTLDVSKWRNGIYFVTVNRPGVKLVEKLVVE